MVEEWVEERDIETTVRDHGSGDVMSLKRLPGTVSEDY
jgi:hypothetical protein